MTAEQLYPLVTEAIRRAETLDDLKAPGTSAAYLDVSLLEEKISESLPASDPEGAIARRGAVRAALSARDLGRAKQLAERFLAEDEVDAELREELLQLSREARGSSRRPAKRSMHYLVHLALALQSVAVGVLLILGFRGYLFGELSQPLAGALKGLTYGSLIMVLVMLVAVSYSERRLHE